MKMIHLNNFYLENFHNFKGKVEFNHLHVALKVRINN